MRSPEEDTNDTFEAMVEVKLFATIRKVAGEKGFKTEASNVQEVLEEIYRKYGPEIRSEMAYCTILVNGRNIAHLRGKRTRLKEGDVISFFPPLAGG